MTKIKGDPENARLINRALILNKLRHSEQLSRAELARMLSLSKMTVSTIVSDLIDEGLIVETGEGDSMRQGGRKPILLKLVDTGLYVIGVDVGLSKTTVALGTVSGLLKAKVLKPTRRNHNPESVIDQIKVMITEIISEQGISKKSILGVGVSIGGLVNKRSGEIKLSPDFNWHNVPLKSRLEEEMERPVVVDNCTRVMALGELWNGEAGRYNNLFYINVGHGIGSAIVMNGKIYDNNSEFGHILITRKDIKCDCGKTGCLEALSSGQAIEKRANAELLEAGDGWHTAKNAAQLANEGNQTAVDIFSDAGRYLGRAISIVANLFNPDRVIIGGGVSGSDNLIMESLMKEFNTHTMDVIKDSTHVEIGSHGMDAGINGAVALALDQYVFHTERV